MGLDITAYTSLKVQQTTTPSGNRQSREIVQFYDNPNFPGSAAGLDVSQSYSYDKRFWFSPGGYTSFHNGENNSRSSLAMVLRIPYGGA